MADVLRSRAICEKHCEMMRILCDTVFIVIDTDKEFRQWVEKEYQKNKKSESDLVVCDDCPYITEHVFIEGKKE